jgi:hypothetical protein
MPVMAIPPEVTLKLMIFLDHAHKDRDKNWEGLQTAEGP